MGLPINLPEDQQCARWKLPWPDKGRLPTGALPILQRGGLQRPLSRSQAGTRLICELGDRPAFWCSVDFGCHARLVVTLPAAKAGAMMKQAENKFTSLQSSAEYTPSTRWPSSRGTKGRLPDAGLRWFAGVERRHVGLPRLYEWHAGWAARR